MCREIAKGVSSSVAFRVAAVIKHLVIDATRVNLRYRGFTGKLAQEAACPIEFTRSFSAGLYEISAIAIATL